MKKWLGISVLLLIFVSLWIGRSATVGSLARSKNSKQDQYHGSIKNALELSMGKTKTGLRKQEEPRPTHDPTQLKDFRLANVELDGVGLNEALQILLRSYQDACVAAGEIPLPLRFAVPSEGKSRIHLKFASKSFNSAVHLVGAIAGFEVKLVGMEYRFKPLNSIRDAERKEVTIGNFQEMIALLGGDGSKSIEQQLHEMGIVLDPSVRFSLSPSGEVIIGNAKVADVRVVNAVLAELGELPIQQKNEFKIMKIPAGAGMDLENGQSLTSREFQLVMRDLAGTPGSSLRTTPTVTSRSGQPSDVEMVREVTIPVQQGHIESETQKVGTIIHAETSALAFGSQGSVNYSDTSFQYDGQQEKAHLQTDASVKGSGYIPDHGTKVYIEVNSDGSRTALFHTTTQMDATGTPTKSSE